MANATVYLMTPFYSFQYPHAPPNDSCPLFLFKSLPLIPSAQSINSNGGKGQALFVPSVIIDIWWICPSISDTDPFLIDYNVRRWSFWLGQQQQCCDNKEPPQSALFLCWYCYHFRPITCTNSRFIRDNVVKNNEIEVSFTSYLIRRCHQPPTAAAPT